MHSPPCALARLAGAGFARHLLPHSTILYCPIHYHRSLHIRPCLRQRAPHDCPQLRSHPPPLNRRGGSPLPGSPAPIPLRSYQGFVVPDRVPRLWFSHLPHRGACRAMSAPGRAVRAPRPPSHPLAPWKRCMLFVGQACTGRVTANTCLRFQGLGGLQSATQRATQGPSPEKSSSLYPTADPGGRAHWLTGNGFSKIAPARQGCSGNVSFQSWLRPALNTPASAPPCAGVRRIGYRDRGSLGNPTGQTNDRLRTGMNGGGPPGPGAGEGRWNPSARFGGSAGSPDRSGDGFLSPGDGLEAGREEGKSLQFEIHVEEFFFRIERRFLCGFAFRPSRAVLLGLGFPGFETVRVPSGAPFRRFQVVLPVEFVATPGSCDGKTRRDGPRRARRRARRVSRGGQGLPRFAA